MRTIGRLSMLTRVILSQVCLLELHDRVLCMVGVLRGGFLEIFLNSLSCLIFCFLFDNPIISTETFPVETKGPSLTFNASRGLITSLSKMSTKACWVLASASTVCPQVALQKVQLRTSFEIVSHFIPCCPCRSWFGTRIERGINEVCLLMKFP